MTYMWRKNFVWNLQIKDELIPEYDSTGLGRESLLTRDNFLQKLENCKSQNIFWILLSTLLLGPCPAEEGEWGREVLRGPPWAPRRRGRGTCSSGRGGTRRARPPSWSACHPLCRCDTIQKEAKNLVWLISRPKVWVRGSFKGKGPGTCISLGHR